RRCRSGVNASQKTNAASSEPFGSVAEGAVGGGACPFTANFCRARPFRPSTCGTNALASCPPKACASPALAELAAGTGVGGLGGLAGVTSRSLVPADGADARPASTAACNPLSGSERDSFRANRGIFPQRGAAMEMTRRVRRGWCGRNRRNARYRASPCNRPSPAQRCQHALDITIAVARGEITRVVATESLAPNPVRIGIALRQDARARQQVIADRESPFVSIEAVFFQVGVIDLGHAHGKVVALRLKRTRSGDGFVQADRLAQQPPTHNANGVWVGVRLDHGNVVHQPRWYRKVRASQKNGSRNHDELSMYPQSHSPKNFSPAAKNAVPA